MEKIENKDRILCSYGCDEVANYIFKNGKYCCSDKVYRCKGFKMSQKNFHHTEEIKKILSKKAKDRGPRSEETKKKISESHKRNHIPSKWKGCKHSEKTKEIMSEKAKKRKRKPCSEETRKKISEANKLQIPAIKGKHHTEETKEKISKSNIGKNRGEKSAWYGKHLTEEHKQKIREKSIGKIILKEQREKISNSVKKLYKNKEYIEWWKKTQNIKPNKQELFLLEIVEKYNFIYVGDFSYWIEGKNPDFMNCDKKLIIEYFGNYWHGEIYRQTNHNDFSTNKEHELQRIKHFERNGYNCLVIWELELKDLDKLETKIIKFIGDNNE